MKVLLTENELSAEWRTQVERASNFRIAMALATRSGMDLIMEPLETQLESGATGQVLIGTDLPTDPPSLRLFCGLQRRFPEQFEVRRHSSETTRFFHPKFSIFSEKKRRMTAILGSSNLTHGGFVDNVESNVLLDSSREVGKLLKFFDVLFLGRNSKAITTAWLREYTQKWKERKAAMAAMRSSRRKIGLIKDRRPGGKRLPRRIKGATFVFTGGLGQGWNRKTVLKKVKYWGGIALDTRPSVKRADVLVEGRIHPYLEDTQKLEIAREHDIPVINSDEFFQMVDNEMKLRGKNKTTRK